MTYRSDDPTVYALCSPAARLAAIFAVARLERVEGSPWAWSQLGEWLMLGEAVNEAEVQP